MKRFVSLIMILIFLFANIWQNAAAAASIKPGLTRGVEILYEKERVRKEALFGERVRFSHKDFLPSCGEREMRGVMISRLPDGEDGILTLAGETLPCGAWIPAEMLCMLAFSPRSDEVSKAEFRFSFGEEDPDRTLYICFHGQDDAG